LGGGVKVLAEDFAARIGGAAADDVIRLTNQIEYLKELRGLDAKSLITNSEYLNRIRLFGDNGIIEFWDDAELDKRIAELTAKLERNFEPTRSRASGGAAGVAGQQVEALTKITEEQQKKLQAAISAGTSQYDLQKQKLQENIVELEKYLAAAIGKTPEQLALIGTTVTEYNRVAEALRNLRFELGELDSAQAKADIELRQDAARREAMVSGGIKQQGIAIPITAEIGKLTDQIKPPENLDEMMDKIYESTNASIEKMLELGTVGEKLADGLHDAFVEFFMNMDKGFKGVLQGFVKLVQRMIAEALAAMAVKALLNAFGFSTAASGGKIFGINKMPAQSSPVIGRATGGMVPVRVGEEGPETAFLPVGTQIMNARQMAYNAQGGGPGAFNYQPVYDIRIQSSGDPRDIEMRLSMMLERRLAQHTQEIYTKMRNNGFGRLR